MYRKLDKIKFLTGFKRAKGDDVSLFLHSWSKREKKIFGIGTRRIPLFIVQKSKKKLKFLPKQAILAALFIFNKISYSGKHLTQLFLSSISILKFIFPLLFMLMLFLILNLKIFPPSHILVVYVPRNLVSQKLVYVSRNFVSQKFLLHSRRLVVVIITTKQNKVIIMNFSR